MFFFLNLRACEGRRLNKALRKAAPGVSTNNTQRRQDRHSYQDNMAVSRQLVGMLACQGTESSRLVSGGRRRQEEARPLGPVGSPTCGQRGLCPGICQVAPGRGFQTGSRDERRLPPGLPSGTRALSPQAAQCWRSAGRCWPAWGPPATRTSGTGECSTRIRPRYLGRVPAPGARELCCLAGTGVGGR